MQIKRIDDTRYGISSCGQVVNLETERVLRQTLNQGGYFCVNLYDPSKRTARVHKLVAEAFLEKVEGKYSVNHISGIKTENDYTNLEWVTSSENTKHAYETGLMKKGSEKSWAKVDEEDVEEILERMMSGDRDVDISKDFPINAGSLSNLRNRRSWKHVRPDLIPPIASRKKANSLNVDDIPVIRKMISSGESDTAIAKHFKVNRGSIYQVRSGKTWKNY